MNYPRLGVNIDHVATLRQQRGESYPNVARAAEVALATGAQQITIHLREDRRHIQDTDVPEVHKYCRVMGKYLNLEIGCSSEMVAKASEEKPAWVCLVPEKREERTTEGGLDLGDDRNFDRVRAACDLIKRHSPQTKISLFVEADSRVLRRCLLVNADAVEIHTGEYARDFLEHKDLAGHLLLYRAGHAIIKEKGWGYHAGHGLTYDSLEPLLKEALFEEYNIGHWIISEAVFIGLGHVVKEMLTLIQKYPLEG
ncbi:MAG TPA: pyridoxine 5'-phosphate synthase [Bacteriovoracaceae bacterium]|nr:pyridoxine 5'-phosphate synthase [Bacteriovoracaceae bacterium]